MIDLEVLQSRLAEGAVALTPNRRLALRLRRDLARALPPETAALTPSIYVLGDWLERLWRGELMRLSEPQLVLSPMQEQQIGRASCRERGVSRGAGVACDMER